jgi:hypothetical protein
LFATGDVDTSGKISVWLIPLANLTLVANLPPVSLTQVANLTPVSTTLAKLVENFAAGDVDTGGAPWIANISANFRNN